MKREYSKPTIRVVDMLEEELICASDVISPGAPNKPAGSREDGFFGEDGGDCRSLGLWDEE